MDMIEIGDSLRIERGPKKVTAKATAELLGAATSDHYVEGAVGADGKRIEKGKDFTYLDIKGAWGFYLYQFQDEIPVVYGEGNMKGEPAGSPVLDDQGQPTFVEAWVEVGYFDDLESAKAEAAKLDDTAL